MIAKVYPIYHHHHLFAHKSTTIRTSIIGQVNPSRAVQQVSLGL